MEISEQIKSCLFSGLSKDKYLSHCKIIESTDPPKPRYLLLAHDTHINQPVLYKSKRNSNGTFSIGKSWSLDSLIKVELLNYDTFKLSLSKSYQWKADRVSELRPFLDALIGSYNAHFPNKISLTNHYNSTTPLSLKPSRQDVSDKLHAGPVHHVQQPAPSPQPRQRPQAQIPPPKPVPPQQPPPVHQPPPPQPRQRHHTPPTAQQQPAKPHRSPQLQQPAQVSPNPQLTQQKQLSPIPAPTHQLQQSPKQPQRELQRPARPEKPTLQSHPSHSPKQHQPQQLQHVQQPSPPQQPLQPQQTQQSPQPPPPPTLSLDTHKLTPKQSFENSTSPIVQKRSHKRNISRPSDASLGDAFSSLARKPSHTSTSESFNDIQQIDEALGGANWRSLRSAAQIDSTAISQHDEQSLTNEINNVEAAMVRSIVSDQDDTMDYLFNYLDSNLAELDDMDALVGKFRAHLMLVGEDISYIESQRGKQTQLNNEQALLDEMEKLDQLSPPSVDVDQADLIVLTKESLESDKGIAALERAAATLYKAIRAHDEQADVVEKRVSEYKTITLQFAKRMLDYLSIMFKFQVDNLINDPTRQISEAKPVIKSHEKMESYLGRYCGLVLFLREMDRNRYKEVCGNYFSSASELHNKEMSKLLAVYANLTHKATEEESDANFSNPFDGMAGQPARKRPDKRLDSKRTKRGDELPAFESLSRVLAQISTQMRGEEVFLQDLLAIHKAPPTFAEFVDLEDVFKRKARDSLSGVDFGPLSDVKSAFDLIFAFLSPALQAWIDGALVKDNMQIVGLIAQLEKSMKNAYKNGQPFLHSMLKKQKVRLNNMFSKYISDQMKAIENTKLTTKKRKGVAPFIRIIPSFVGRIEAQLVNVADDWEIRKNVNDAYDKIIGRMFDSLKQIAKEEDSLDVSGEDKGALNLHVIMIANSHYFLQAFKAKPMKALTPFLVTSESLYSTHLESYVRLLWRRHLHKQIDYFEGLEKALKTTKASEMISHPTFGKSAYKRIVRDYTAKDLKKSTEALHKRVEKHFDVNIEDEVGYNEVMKVIEIVWKALEDYLTTWTNDWNQLIAACFAGLEGLHYTQTDIRLSFKNKN